jgi:hypothetical protein
MSRRYGDDDTTADDDDSIQPNAVCSDCGVSYSRAELDSTPFCDACSDKRDAWATAQELRTIAKAVLKVDLTKTKDVA